MVDLIRDQTSRRPRRAPGGAPRTPQGAPRESLEGPLAEALEALTLMAAGYSPREVAEMRGRSVAQVRADLERLFAYLGVATLPKAIAETRRRGLIG